MRTRLVSARLAAVPVVAMLILSALPAEVRGATSTLRLTKWGRFREPIDFVVRPSDRSHVYIAEKAGRVIQADTNGKHRTTVLDLRSRVVNSGEQGLLSIAWDDKGSALYVHYSKSPSGDTQVSRFRRTTAGTFAREQSVLKVHQPASNHNGGTIRFDGSANLLIALGDGGGSDDKGDGHAPGGNAQSKNSLLGKLLRITPTPDAERPYRSTSGNPFIGTAGKDEIFVMGLRNPYRFDLDRTTGMLWIADVGQGEYEEIDRIAYKNAAGANFGWARREGKHSFGDMTAPRSVRFVEPVYEVSHADGNCAIIGGVVARDPRVQTLSGKYLFTDYCTGKIEAITPSGLKMSRTQTKLHVESPTGFGADATGRVHVLSQDGVIYRIES